MTCTSRACRRWGALFALASSLAALGSAPVARAQMCSMADEDGGMCVDDDGGLVIAQPTDDDGGMSMAPMAGSSGRAGSGGSGSGGSGGRGALDAGTRPGGPADACSCTATDDDKQGRVHVCTEGQTRAACDDFSCTLGRVDLDHACSHDAIQLCCVMKSRGLVSVLYDDCTHPNCKAGFTQQCADFDGTLHDADCESLVSGPSHHDDSGDGCAVQSTSASSDLSGIALGLGLLLVRRRRSRYLAV
jgi:MYXO-CTERM domain-containing protein